MVLHVVYKQHYNYNQNTNTIQKNQYGRMDGGRDTEANTNTFNANTNQLYDTV